MFYNIALMRYFIYLELGISMPIFQIIYLIFLTLSKKPEGD